MAFLNEYKRRAVRRTNEYQVLMEDLVGLGVVSSDKYFELIGHVKHEDRPNAKPTMHAARSDEPVAARRQRGNRPVVVDSQEASE